MIKSKSKMTLRSRSNDGSVEFGGGNVFADLGFPNAEARLAKAKLATDIAQSIDKRGWTQLQIAERTGLGPAEISRLLRGQLSGFSADRLVPILNGLESHG
jgi:predicted XRE-type DNA-binding protein